MRNTVSRRQQYDLIDYSDELKHSPGPKASWGDQALGVGALVRVEADQVSCCVEAHHDAQGVKTQPADGEMAGPPGTDPDEQQIVQS